MAAVRVEQDLLGEREVPAEALYGVYTVRAVENFPLARRPVHPALVRAYGAVKLACALTNAELSAGESGAEGEQEKFAALARACRELQGGELDGQIVVDALQGGAGTSLNMNVNEVLANRTLQLLGRPLGDYAAVSPLDDVNRHQSTNDTFPTALRVAAIQLLRELERAVVALQEALQQKEREFAGVVKVGRTQLQDAVLTTLGRSMGAYAEAFGRDRWRIYKCEERLRVVNLGGTAIGTGVGAPREYIFQVIEHLRAVTGLGLARAENLVEATQNADAFVEVSGILKACATNVLKMSGDLRLLASGPDAGIGELQLPARQAGSSIMPAKVNPVIPEAASQVAMLVMGNDQVIAQACAAGSLELNPFLPLVADCLLNSVELLARACDMLRRFCVEGLRADEARCRALVERATVCLAGLVPRIGYLAAQEIGQAAAATGQSVRQIVLERGLLTAEEFDQVICPEAVLRLGSPAGKAAGRGGQE